MLRFVLAVLATWRVTHLLANEAGPADPIYPFRPRPGQTLAGQLMDFFNCLRLLIPPPSPINAPSQGAPPAPPSPASTPAGSITIRYLQTAAVRVQGLTTGRSYEFSASQQVQNVDARDASSLLSTPFFSRA